MTTYMITYYLNDNCGCGHDHEHEHEHDHEHDHSEDNEGKLIAKIKSVGAWAHFMPEAYLVKSDLTALEILEELKAVANSGDNLFVTKTETESCACQNQAVLDWIRK